MKKQTDYQKVTMSTSFLNSIYIGRIQNIQTKPIIQSTNTQQYMKYPLITLLWHSSIRKTSLIHFNSSSNLARNTMIHFN